MKISTKGRYGLRLMVDLAVRYDCGLVTLKDIASRQNISEKYLEQIIMLLNKGGLLRSVRGAQGGYSLSQKPEDITVGMVLRAVEGSLAPVECAENCAACPKSAECVTVGVWRKIKTAVEDVVDSITLKDLADEQTAKTADNYCI